MKRKRKLAKERAAGIVLFRVRRDERHEYLILRNARHHSWGFAKGHIEAGETERHAALREVYEETGLRPTRFIRGFSHRSHYAVRRGEERIEKSVVYFLAKAPRGTLRTSPEHDLAKWELPGRAAWYVQRFANLVDALARAERVLLGPAGRGR